MRNTLFRLIGWKATVLHGDPSVFDRWVWLRDHLQPGPLRTLDAGCGSGVFTMYAAKIGNQSLGLSFDELNNQVAAARAKLLGLSNLRFERVDLREVDKVAPNLGTFDQIICFEVIEHILNDRKLLRDLTSMLNPGGRLLLTTPYKYAKKLFGDGKPSEIENGGHVRIGYTPEELKQLFEQYGLACVVEEFLSGFVSQLIINVLRMLNAVDHRLAWAITFPLRALQVADRPFTKLIRYPFISVAMVGVKEAAYPLGTTNATALKYASKQAYAKDSYSLS
jgi:SAM-dependent methyltransferase